MAQLDEGIVQQPVSLDILRQLPGDVVKGDRVAARGGFGFVELQCHAPLQGVSPIGGGADDKLAEAILVPDVAVALEAILEAIKRMVEGSRGDDREERAAQPHLARDMQNLQCPVIIEQDPVLQIADEHALVEILEHAFKAPLLFVGVADGLGDLPLGLLSRFYEGFGDLLNGGIEEAEIFTRLRIKRAGGSCMHQRAHILDDMLDGHGNVDIEFLPRPSR